MTASTNVKRPVHLNGDPYLRGIIVHRFKPTNLKENAAKTHTSRALTS